MKFALVSCALIAGVIAASTPSPMQGRLAEKHFLPILQQVMDKESITGSIGTAQSIVAQLNEAEEAAAVAKGLTCEQIRIMDEVEFITDDTYCPERS